jgi:diacylglycerol kinase family enzyme
MRRGRLTEQPDIAHHRGRVIEVELPEGTQFNVDGELCEEGWPARFAVLPGGVEVVIP